MYSITSCPLSLLEPALIVLQVRITSYAFLSPLLIILHMERSEASSAAGILSSGMEDSPEPTIVENPRGRSPTEKSEASKSSSEYMFDGLTGWKRFRVLRPCRGMYHDVRRRLPYYLSDITDAFTYRTIASTVRMYFVK